MKIPRLTSNLALTGSFALSLLLLTGCTVGPFSTDAQPTTTTTTTVTAAPTTTPTDTTHPAAGETITTKVTTPVTKEDCSAFLTNCDVIRNNIETSDAEKINNLKASGAELITTINKQPGAVTLSPASQGLMTTVASNSGPNSPLDQLLSDVQNAPDTAQFLPAQQELDLTLQAATKAQDDAKNQIGKELNVDLNAAANTDDQLNGQKDNVAALVNGTADLQGKVNDLKTNSSLSADAQTSLDKLSSNLGVLSDQLNQTSQLGFDQDSLMTANGNLQVALQATEKSLADANAKLAADSTANGASQLALPGDAAVLKIIGALPATTPTSTDLNGSANATVSGTTPKSIPSVVAPAHTNAIVNGTIKGTVNTPVIKIPTKTVTTPTDKTVTGTVNSTLNGNLTTTTPIVTPIVNNATGSVNTTLNSAGTVTVPSLTY